MMAVSGKVKMMNYPTAFIVDLSPVDGLIAVSGQDAVSFLQGQLTVDMHEIKTKKHSLAAFCNLKGRIHALFRLFYDQDTYYLAAPKEIISPAVTQLKKFARFSKVTLTEVSEQWQHFGIFNAEYFDAAGIICLKLSNNPQRVELWGLISAMQAQWNKLSLTLPIKTVNEWKLLDIEAGIPNIWPETQEKFLPHYLNLPQLGAVSFSKGCYVGQEIIARMQYRGNVKRGLSRALIDNLPILPAPGTSLAGGIVVSAAFDDNGKIALLLEAPIVNPL
jgi:folate-binding protein YgfZ